MTALLITLVSLIDFVTSHFISEYHLALYAEAAATIAVGFALIAFAANSIASGTDLLKAHFHQAEAQLDRVARSLEFSTREESIREALVDEPARSAQARFSRIVHGRRRPPSLRALAQRRLESRQRRGNARRRSGGALSQNRTLAARRQRRRLGRRVASKGAAAPAYFVPIFCREALHGFVVYGAHADTTALDPGECSLRRRARTARRIAYDHLTYEVMRRQLADPPSARRSTRTFSAWLGREKTKTGEAAHPTSGIIPASECPADGRRDREREAGSKQGDDRGASGSVQFRYFRLQLGGLQPKATAARDRPAAT